jgi:hypothetical protein
MTELNPRDLRTRISDQQSKLRDRLAELLQELRAVQADPPPDVLRRERQILAEGDALQARLWSLGQRWLMLSAYEYQKQHGFPLLDENKKPRSIAATAGARPEEGVS